mmetsp:Transcript_37959/g.61494  ORF Transcript_37959/g.61494 Transcript_37959/m.61494 type:complete len:542 (+) Transcript_37959:437-2062(+)
MLSLKAFTQKTCEVCNDCIDAVEFRCNTCGKNLCAFGAYMHERLADSPDHVVRRFNFPSKDVSSFKGRDSFCSEHLGHRLDFFCESPGCDKPVCLYCVNDDHKAHQYGTIAKFGGKHKTIVSALLKETQARVAQLSTSMCDIRTRMAEVRSQKEELSSKVTTSAQSLIDAIMEKQSELLSQIENIANAKTKSLSEQMDLVATFKADTERSNDFVCQVISEGRTVDILSLKAPLVTRLSECKSHAIRLDPSEEPNLRLSFDVSSIASSIQSCGSVTVSRTSPSFSILSGNALTDLNVKTHIPYQLTLSLLDVNGEAVLDEQPVIDATLSHIFPVRSLPVSAPVNGTCFIDLSFPFKAEYQLIVSLDQIPVHGCPYVIKVNEDGPAFPTWKGIQLDVDMSLYGGWTCRYEKPYSERITAAEIDDACKGFKYALVGAYCKDSPARLALAAWGESAEILKKTTSTTEAHEVNGAFWYFHALRSFGFAPTATIHLSSTDFFDGTDNKRLSWWCGGLRHQGGRVGTIVNTVAENVADHWFEAIYCWN